MPTLYQHSANIGPTSMRQQRYYNIQPTLDQHPCANSDITIFSQQWANVIIPTLYIPTFSQHWTNIHAPTALLQYSANIGPTSMRQQRYYNIQPTMGQCHYTNAIYSNIQPTLGQHTCANSDITTYLANTGPASMRQQRYYNLFSQHWASIHAPTAILQPIQPTLGHHSCANCNIQPTLGQQYCTNGDVTTLSQHWANIIVFAGLEHKHRF